MFHLSDSVTCSKRFCNQSSWSGSQLWNTCRKMKFSTYDYLNLISNIYLYYHAKITKVILWRVIQVT